LKVKIFISEIYRIENPNIPPFQEIEIASGSVLDDSFLSFLRQKHPEIDFQHTLIVINGAVVSDLNIKIQDGDKIYFFPPIMGG